MKSKTSRILVRVVSFALALAMFVTVASVFSPSASALTVTKKTVAAGTAWATPLYVIDSGKAGPTVWVVGGTHGNEPGGYNSANIIKNWTVTKGRLVVLPNSNLLADKAFVRYVSSTGDLNRSFPKTSTGTPTSTLARSIWSYMKTYRPTWLVDLHEGYNFHLVDHAALGSTVISYPNSETQKVASMIAANENKSISISSHKFVTMTYPVPGSIARAAGQFLGAHAVTSETSVKQTMATREKQDETLVQTMLHYLGMR